MGLTRVMNGKRCSGYMDYYGNTEWSQCNVNDFKEYISDCGPFCRRCKRFCLEPLGNVTVDDRNIEHSNECEVQQVCMILHIMGGYK